MHGYEEVLRCKNKSCEHYPKGGKAAPVDVGDTVLIWGDHFGAADAAEKLGTEGKKVYIVTEKHEFAEWMDPAHSGRDDAALQMRERGGATGKVFAQPVTIITDSTVLEIRKDGEVVLTNNKFAHSTLHVDNVILATMKEDTSVFEGYEAAGLLVTKIGDLKKVRNLRGAVTDGANIGLTLDRTCSAMPTRR